MDTMPSSKYMEDPMNWIIQWVSLCLLEYQHRVPKTPELIDVARGFGKIGGHLTRPTSKHFIVEYKTKNPWMLGLLLIEQVVRSQELTMQESVWRDRFVRVLDHAEKLMAREILSENGFGEMDCVPMFWYDNMDEETEFLAKCAESPESGVEQEMDEKFLFSHATMRVYDMIISNCKFFREHGAMNPKGMERLEVGGAMEEVVEKFSDLLGEEMKKAMESILHKIDSKQLHCGLAINPQDVQLPAELDHLINKEGHL